MQFDNLKDAMEYGNIYVTDHIIPVTDETQFKFKVVRCANRKYAKDSKRYFADYESAVKFIKKRSYHDLDDFVYYELHVIYTNDYKNCGKYKFLYQHREQVGLESYRYVSMMVWNWF